MIIQYYPWDDEFESWNKCTVKNAPVGNTRSEAKTLTELFEEAIDVGYILSFHQR